MMHSEIEIESNPESESPEVVHMDISDTQIPDTFDYIENPEPNQTVVTDIYDYVDMMNADDDEYNKKAYEDPKIDFKVLNKCYIDKRMKVIKYREFNCEIIGYEAVVKVIITKFNEKNEKNNVYYVHLEVRDDLSPNRWYNLSSELDECFYQINVDMKYSSNLELLN